MNIMDNREKISGNIYARKESLEKCGYEFVIISKNGSGWGLPTKDISPKDLRKLADFIESKNATTEKIPEDHIVESFEPLSHIDFRI